MNGHGIETEHPVTVVDWISEGRARFEPPMSPSVLSGKPLSLTLTSRLLLLSEALLAMALFSPRQPVKTAQRCSRKFRAGSEQTQNKNCLAC